MSTETPEEARLRTALREQSNSILQLVAERDEARSRNYTLRGELDASIDIINSQKAEVARLREVLVNADDLLWAYCRIGKLDGNLASYMSEKIRAALLAGEVAK